MSRLVWCVCVFSRFLLSGLGYRLFRSLSREDRWFPCTGLVTPSQTSNRCWLARARAGIPGRVRHLCGCEVLLLPGRSNGLGPPEGTVNRVEGGGSGACLSPPPDTSTERAPRWRPGHPNRTRTNPQAPRPNVQREKQWDDSVNLAVRSLGGLNLGFHRSDVPVCWAHSRLSRFFLEWF